MNENHIRACMPQALLWLHGDRCYRQGYQSFRVQKRILQCTAWLQHTRRFIIFRLYQVFIQKQGSGAMTSTELLFISDANISPPISFLCIWLSFKCVLVTSLMCFVLPPTLNTVTKEWKRPHRIWSGFALLSSWLLPGGHPFHVCVYTNA